MSRAEPIRATVRDNGTDDYVDIECRMSDGQKGVFIKVDADFPNLIHDVCNLPQLKLDAERYRKLRGCSSSYQTADKFDARVDMLP